MGLKQRENVLLLCSKKCLNVLGVFSARTATPVSDPIPGKIHPVVPMRVGAGRYRTVI